MKNDQEKGPAMKATSNTPTWTRRGFLQSTLGGMLAAGVAACDNVEFEEEEPLFDGPQIDEEDFIAFNAGYYDIGVDTKTQLPYSSISGEGSTGETDPASIAFRLQYLIDQGRTASAPIETMLDHLLAAQISDLPPRNYRNLLPRLAFNASETGLEPVSREYFVSHNAMLSARVAMAAQAFKGAAIEDKALTFLAYPGASAFRERHEQRSREWACHEESVEQADLDPKKFLAIDARRRACFTCSSLR